MAEERIFKVMLSSTFLDLETHRQIVDDALRKFGLHPIRMENDVTRSDRDVIDSSLAMVDAADAYFCILGKRYGAIPDCPDRNPNGLSTTALEFERAKARGLPVAALVLGADYPLADSQIDFDEALRAGLAALKAEIFGYRIAKEVTSEQAFRDAVPHAAHDLVVVLRASSRRAADFPGIDLADELLENLALRFGVENPDAPRRELVAFLKDKAAEYKDLKARLDALGAAEARLQNMIAAADAAIRAGDFDAADAVLADAEAIQQEDHTLLQVRKLADIRTARADAALLKGDADMAYTHFAGAADMLQPFEAMESVSRREAAISRLFRHGLRVGGVALGRSISLARANLDLLSEADTPHEWARA